MTTCNRIKKSGLYFLSEWAWWIWLWILWAKLWGSNGRKKRQEILLRIEDCCHWPWARQCNVFEWCRVELLKFSVNSSTIVFHFSSKCIRGPATKSFATHFCFLKKRWPPSPTAEPEVQAVPPRRPPPSARKSRLHPSLRRFPEERSCLLLDGSTKCPTISGCTRSFNRFWI